MIRLALAFLALACTILLARDMAREETAARSLCEARHSPSTCQHIMR